MNTAYKRIVVVGGGTAGWMTAIALATGLPGSTVELVESEEARRACSGWQFARVRDFIILHYCLTARRDNALWRTMATMALPDTLCGPDPGRNGGRAGAAGAAPAPPKD